MMGGPRTVLFLYLSKEAQGWQVTGAPTAGALDFVCSFITLDCRQLMKM